ncbi:MAG: polysaccharide export outer membrane protein [Lentimonas sp.]|jgi:polysaccharide export outer membrane protein
MSRICNIMFALVLAVFSGCQSRNAPETFDPRSELERSRLGSSHFIEMEGGRELRAEWLRPSLEPYRLGVGDWVDVEISGVDSSRAQTFVMPDGRVYYDLAGGVLADGLTVEMLGATLEAALLRDYSSPSVNVTLREVNSRRAWLLGRLNKPGLYPLSQPTTLLEGISLAGGLFTSRFSGTTEELADLGQSFVLRDGKVLPINLKQLIKEGDLSQNIYLEDGDYVYLPSSTSQSVYVLGEVVAPQSIGFKDDISLVSAISKARGPTQDANLEGVLVIRGSLTEPRVAVVDLRAIFSGQATDFKLEPFDVVWVPDRPFKLLERYFWVIVDSAATTIAVREGANAVEGAGSTSVTIPISR